MARSSLEIMEMNNFTRDLTMNVQDVQEVVLHYERKDLMPEGEIG